MFPRFHKAITVVLLAVFSVYLVPKEFVHACYGHIDTQDEVFGAHTPKAIGKHHIHCDFLSYEASLFTTAFTAAFPLVAAHLYAYFDAPVQQPVISPSAIPSLRGPPLS